MQKMVGAIDATIIVEKEIGAIIVGSFYNAHVNQKCIHPHCALLISKDP